MPEPELFLLFVRPLNRAGIRYVTTALVEIFRDILKTEEEIATRG